MSALDAITDGDSTEVGLSKTRLRLWLKVLKTAKLIENDLRERLRLEFDTTLPRFDVMAALYRAETGLKMSALSGELKVSNGNVTGIIDRLVSENIVERVPVEGDRRAMLVRLTTAGRQSFATMADAHESWVNELLESVSQAEGEDFIHLLTRIDDQFEPDKVTK